MAESEKEKQELVGKILKLNSTLGEEELMRNTLVHLKEYLKYLEMPKEVNERPMGVPFN
jgi:hypothetical protein